ncbi:MAG: hypothetical protein FWE35_14245 [Streptosporangiales bacterium]|nr:hypothetical protein [Streptosporangiales bacterium]
MASENASSGDGLPGRSQYPAAISATARANTMYGGQPALVPGVAAAPPLANSECVPARSVRRPWPSRKSIRPVIWASRMERGT